MVNWLENVWEGTKWGLSWEMVDTSWEMVDTSWATLDKCCVAFGSQRHSSTQVQ